MLQETNIVCHAVAALADGGQYVKDPAVQLPGVGLAADGEALAKTEISADHPVHLVNFGGIPVIKVHEAGLGAGGAPAAQKLHAADNKVQLLQVAHQVLDPQGGPLAHGDQLGRLIVGVAQGGHGLVGIRELPQVLDHL